jgi:Lrp/AsnC family leucine-responsive transcriptional regulator
MNPLLNLTDMSICDHLVVDAKMTMKVLGQKVFLSEDAVRKRVKRLEEDGFILGYHAMLKRMDVQAKVSGNNHIRLISNTGDCIERFMRCAMAIPEIINCQHVAADGYDFIVTIQAFSLIEHNKILSVQLCQNFDVHPVSTAFVLSETKGRNVENLKSYIKNGLNKAILFLAYFSVFLGT